MVRPSHPIRLVYIVWEEDGPESAMLEEISK